MINSPESINIVPSGYRILYVLSLLLQGRFSQKEINDKLSSNPCIEQAFTKDTLLKIINTLKIYGVKINKSEGRYFVSEIPWQIEFPPKYIETLAELRAFVLNLGQENLDKNYSLFLGNLFRYLPESSSELIYGRYDDAKSSKYQKYLQFIKKIEQAKKNNFRIKVNFSGGGYIFDSYYIEYETQSVFLCGYNIKEHENKRINISELKSIKQLPQKSSGVFFPSCITFRLKGRLAKSYNLRENEKLIAYDSDSILIASKGEDKKTLLRRLMKYKDLCEVIAPESFREDFVTILKNTLCKYETL